MDCREVREAVFLYTDGVLEAERRDAFQRHLDLCPGCDSQIRFSRAIRTLLRRRCCRFGAPERLRQRILVSFPHRQVQIVVE